LLGSSLLEFYSASEEKCVNNCAAAFCEYLNIGVQRRHTCRMQLSSGFVKRSNAFSASFSFMRSASAARYFSNLENENNWSVTTGNATA